MSLRIAIQMDPIASINPAGDTTLLLGAEAQARGHPLFYYTPDKLSLEDGNVIAHLAPISLRLQSDDYYTLGQAEYMSLTEMDVILMRNDPPFDMGYLSATYMLEQLPKTVHVLNHPTSVRNHPEKLLPFAFPEFIPATLISRDASAITSFIETHGGAVLKPLFGHGGNAIFRIDAQKNNLASLLELFEKLGHEPLVVQRYLPEVATEERRILLIDGEVAGTIGRIPTEGEIRSNFRVGGSAKVVELTETQRRCATHVGAHLKKIGIYFAGLDMIGDHLIEINITSPTGMRQITDLTKDRPATFFWERLENSLS